MLGSNVLVRKALSLLGSVNQNPLALVTQRAIDRGRDLLPDSNVSLNLVADGLDRGMRTQKREGEGCDAADTAPHHVFQLVVGIADILPDPPPMASRARSPGS